MQTAFQQDVKRVVDAFEEWGSHFLEQGKELYVLNFKNVIDGNVVETCNENSPQYWQ